MLVVLVPLMQLVPVALTVSGGGANHHYIPVRPEKTDKEKMR